jgi:SAM-dependent methyltransferase
MHGYDASSYGEGLADVYDEWYGAEADPIVLDALERLAGPGPVLELGVGTGRLAVPLAARGVAVHGVDSSPAMLARLAAKPGADRVATTCADMAGTEPAGPFALVFATTNTFFNLHEPHDQERCFANVTARLVPGGRFAIEVFVPAEKPPSGRRFAVRDIALDRVVLSVTQTEADEQTAFGQHIEITEAGGVRLRPWRIRWAAPAQLDDLARRAGLVLEARWAGWAGQPFTTESAHHVSVYRLDEGHNLG